MGSIVGSTSLSKHPNDESESNSADSHNAAFSSKELNVTPLWTMMKKMVPPSPNPQAAVTKWAYSQMRPQLTKATEIVSAEEAERRVLVLVNSAMRAPYTTDTIYAGLQIVLPGETAPAHRHRAFALRFIIEGSAGFTAVEGEKITMSPGDVILTPSWTWHDHGNEGTEPIVWLDGLDLPLWQFLPINFMQPYSEPRYPSSPASESVLRFPWSETVKVLNANLQDKKHAVFHYRDRDSSAHLSKTISAQAERIAKGHTTHRKQEVISFVYHVFRGSGYTIIKTPGSDREEKIEWTVNDTFAVPAWSTISHTCTDSGSSSSDSGDAYLFAINDRPLVEALTFVDAGVLKE